MRKSILLLVFALVSLASNGQRIDPAAFSHELSIGTGIGASLNGEGGSDATFWMNYSHYYNRHVGYRAGVQYMPSNMGVDDFVCFPLAMSFRTALFDYSDYTYSALFAMDMLDAFLWEGDNIFVDMLAILLLTTINRGEFFFGLTPGLVLGDSNIRTAYYTGMDGNVYKEYHGINKAGILYCSADAGVNFSWRIWRFTINLTPVFRWNFTNNYRIYSAYEDTVYPQNTPVNWMFNLNFGLGYMF